MDYSEPGPSQSYILELYDPQEDRMYKININDEDYNRALNDEMFAQSLLNHVKHSDVSISNSKETLVLSDENTTPSEEFTNSTSTTSQNTSRTNRLCWSYDAIKLLLASMENYLEDMNDLKRRKHIFSNISNELLSAGFEFTDLQVQEKWKSLMRTYNRSKDRQKESGRAPSRFYFFDAINKLVGDKPENSCEHTLESSEDTSVECQESVPQMSTRRSRPNQSQKRHSKALKFQMDVENERKHRHNEILALEKEKIEIEKKKIGLLENILNKM